VTALVELRSLTAPVRSAGLFLGHDRRNRPIVVRMFAPQPTQLTVVGGGWLGQLLVFRALAMGARAIIRSNAPEQWYGFGQAATGRNDRVQVGGVDQAVGAAAGPGQPLLVLDDFGAAGAPTNPAPWTSHITLLRKLTDRGAAVLQAADLVLLQRLTPSEAEVAAGARRLEPRNALRMQALFDDMVALLGGELDRHLTLAVSPIELQLLGPATRDGNGGG